MLCGGSVVSVVSGLRDNVTVLSSGTRTDDVLRVSAKMIRHGN